MTPSAVRQMKALGQLMRLEPKRFLFGGWAEDALLHGRASREHSDIDLLVPLDELDALLAQLQALGFADVHVKFRVERGKPIVVAVYRDDVELELIVHQVAPDGRGFFDLPVGDALERFWFPPGAFDGPESRLGDLRVRTISPLALYQVRDFCQGVFGGMRDKDRVTQAALKAKYFATTPEAQLLAKKT